VANSLGLSMKPWSPAVYLRRSVAIKMAHINGVYLAYNETSRLLREYAASGGYLIRLSWSGERHKKHPAQRERLSVKDIVDPCLAKLSGRISVLALRIVVRSINYLFSWARTVDFHLIHSPVESLVQHAAYRFRFVSCFITTASLVTHKRDLLFIQRFILRYTIQANRRTLPNHRNDSYELFWSPPRVSDIVGCDIV